MAENDSIKDLLNTDPLGQAEKITGESYKDDEGTAALGMLLHMQHTQNVRDAMELNADTHYNSTFEEVLAVYDNLGFEQVYEDEFYAKTDGQRERELILWHPDGVLAYVNSHTWAGREPKINTSKIHFNWKYNEGVYPQGMSGRTLFDGETNLRVFSGDRDVRTGLRYHFEDMRTTGQFLNPWLDRPWLWFVNHGENDSAYKAITEAKIALLDKDVREAFDVPERAF